MAAVPPPSGNDDEPDAVAFGIPALDDRIGDADLAFPASAEEIVAGLDDPEIPYDPYGHTIRLSDAIERTDRHRFESRRDLLNALHPVFEAARDGAGITAWLRRLFPM